MEIARLQALITADDRQFRSKMDAADKKGEDTARSISASFSNLKLNIPSIGGGLNKLKNEIGGAFAGLGTELLTASLGALKSGFSAVITTGMDFRKMMEGASIVFENLAGSAEGAQKHLNDLKEFAKSSPFDLPDLIQASARMQAFSYSTASVVPNLRNLQNAAALAAGTSGNFTESLNGIVTALGQMRANQRVSAEEMNQLTERGIPAWDLLAQKIGKTVAETRKLSEEGKLRGAPAAEALLEAFGEGKFAGLGEKLAKTTLGKESNLRDALTQQAGDAAEDTIQAYNSALDEALKRAKTPAAANIGKVANAPVAAGLQIASDLSSGQTTLREIGRALPQTAIDTGKELKDILTKGIAGAWSAVKEVTTGIAESAGTSSGDALVKGTKDSLQMHSPSRVMIELGEHAGISFAVGFENGKASIKPISAEDLYKKQASKAEKLGYDDAFKREAEKRGIRPEVLAAIASRESNMRNIIGDGGRGAGLMQVDIGTDAAFKASGAWKDAFAGIAKGADVLREKMDWLVKMAGKETSVTDRAGNKYKFTVPKLEGEELERTAIAMYNSGAFAPYHVSKGRSPDYGTTGKDYSADVLKRAEVFKQEFSDGGQAVRSFRSITDQASQSLKTFVLNVGAIGGDGVQAKPYPGQIIDGGTASMTVRAPQELLALSPEVQSLTANFAALRVPLREVKDMVPPLTQAQQQATQSTRNWADEIIESSSKVNNATERLASFKDRLGQGFDDLIGALVTGSDRWQDVAKNIAVDFFNTLASEMMLSATGGKYGSLGGLLGGLVGGLFGGAFGFGGKKAAGGPVRGGKTYLVGEEGPELFMPGASGRIVPAGQTAQMMTPQKSITVVNNFTIQAPGGKVAPETQQQIAARAGAGIQAALARNS